MNRRGYIRGHLGEYLEDYVDGTLPEAQARRAAQHVVTCSVCRDDVDAERDVLRRVRSVSVDPHRQADLVAGLLAFSPEAPAEPPSCRRPSVAVVAPSSPAHYSGRHRTPVVCAAALALGCAGLVAASHVTPQRTAPGDGRTVQVTSRQLLTDDVAAPQVQSAGYAQANWAEHPSGPVLRKQTTSGTIAP